MHACLSDNTQHRPAQAHDPVAGKSMADTHAHKARIRRCLELVAFGGEVSQPVRIECEVEAGAAIGMILKYPALALFTQAIAQKALSVFPGFKRQRLQKAVAEADINEIRAFQLHQEHQMIAL